MVVLLKVQSRKWQFYVNPTLTKFSSASGKDIEMNKRKVWAVWIEVSVFQGQNRSKKSAKTRESKPYVFLESTK